MYPYRLGRQRLIDNVLFSAGWVFLNTLKGVYCPYSKWRGAFTSLPNAMISEKIRFDNGRGQILTGRLDRAEDGPSDTVALFAHCFTCTKNLKAIANISKALVHEGITVLRFDFTGLGESEGDFEETNFTSNTEDLIAASRYLGEAYRPPKLLIGHSLGGAAVLQAAGSIESSRAVATIAAPCEPGHLKELLKVDDETLRSKGEVEINIGGRPFRMKKQFFDDLDRRGMDFKIHNLKRALLILHSPADSIVSIDNAAHIFQAARHPKSFISLDRADHLLMHESDTRYAGSVIAAWVRRYL
jgi:alpha/beta superfamily hydrolase